MKYENVLKTIGKTPVVKINKLFPAANKRGIEIYMKLERTNPGGSIKDRIALAMVEDAEKRGDLKPGGTIVEPTSGNTGVGLALVAAVKGYNLIITMPESMSLERRKLMSLYGARLVLTPKEKGMNGAIAKARELAQENEGSWIPMQFENQSNVEVHARETASEIFEDFGDSIDYLITGVGTGGHITGCAREMRKRKEGLEVFAVEPVDSPVLSGGEPGPHPLQGIGAGFAPDILDRGLLTGVVKVGKEEAFSFAQRAAREEGLLVGISSGASLAAVNQKLAEVKDGSKVLTFAYDTGERYLSVEGLF